MSKVISTNNVPAAIGPYSQAIAVGNLVFTSGQIPIDPATGEFVSGGIREQAHQVCKNISEVLKAAGSSIEKSIKTTCFVADIADFADFNEVYGQYFTNKPARSCVAVKDLPKGALIELEVIAEIN